MSSVFFRAHHSRGGPRHSAARTAVLAVAVATAAVGLTVAGVTGCAALTAGPTNDTQQSQTYQRAISQIDFTMPSGNITLSAGASGSVVVSRDLKWDKTEPTVSEVWSGDTLQITVNCPSQPHCSVDYTVQVPSTVAVQTHTDDGDVSVSNLSGGVNINDTTGDVTLAGVAGRIQVDSNTGTVTGTALQSTDVGVQGQDGDLELSFSAVPQNVSATTDTGRVHVSLPSNGATGYQVHASATTGQRTVSVQEEPSSSHTITAKSTDGDVTVD
jgi:hypothetical protein